MHFHPIFCDYYQRNWDVDVIYWRKRISTYSTGKRFFLFIILTIAGASVALRTQADASKFCGGASSLLLLVDRPTISNSPCTVSAHQRIFELGFQAEQLAGAGNQQSFPTAELRMGLPADYEVYVNVPNYTQQSVLPFSGFSFASMGIKHEVKYTEHWLFTVNGTFIPPSGSAEFGSKRVGAMVNGIFNYLINSKVSFTCQLGLSTQTESAFAGGQRYNSINPDAFFTWSLSDKLQAYTEIYGQSKTGAGEGSGFNAAGGFVYLLAPNMTVDVEAGQRLYGLLYGIEHYLGAGLALRF